MDLRSPLTVFLAVCGVLLLTAQCVVSQTKEQWWAAGKAELKEALSRRQNWGVAKNVVVFLGDGMGVSTVTAARILRGQLRGLQGEETFLSFERFPDVGLIKTYEVDQQIPDSAGTATALLSGVKTNMGVIGLDSSAKRGDCAGQAGKEVTTLLDWALQEGKSVGIVTTSRVTHATPAAAYAHSADRDWENDGAVSAFQGRCKDIADQLITDNPNIQVILGGGRRNFMDSSTLDPESNRAGVGDRSDGRNLIQEWLNDKQKRRLRHQFVWNRQQLSNVNTANTDYLFGLFEADHMKYVVDRTSQPTDDPSLAQMTQKALEILQRNEKGYFLFVEGARIDHGHHDNKAKRALYEVLDMDEAVATVDRMSSERDTLMVVTADHSHVFNIQGYTARGNSIFGKTDYFLQPLDGLPATTLVYANGPNSRRQDITGVDTASKDFSQFAGVPMLVETHSGEDVSCYARGPMSHLIQSTHEQNYIAHALAYAACLGTDKSHCAQQPRDPCSGQSQTQGQGQQTGGQGQSQGQGQGQNSVQGAGQGQGVTQIPMQTPGSNVIFGAGQRTTARPGSIFGGGVFSGLGQGGQNPAPPPRQDNQFNLLRSILQFFSRL